MGLLAGTLLACANQPSAWRDPQADPEWMRRSGIPPSRAKNVVLMVGDGMGLTTVTAARILEGQQRGEPGEDNSLAFERLPYLALSKTYNTNQQVPDSAGTMTAMVTGTKTFAGAISVGPGIERGDFEASREHRLETLFERAEALGVSTGLVTTTSVTHATPAACYAHSPERNWQGDSDMPEDARAAGFPDIARQLIEFEAGNGLDVVLGGGRLHFMSRDQRDPELLDMRGTRLDGRDLIADWVAQREGSAYVWNAEQFFAIDPDSTGPLLGLFAPNHMAFEYDRESDPAGEPSLSEMTSRALAILARNAAGYLLMVEGGRIDHAHHGGNAYRALTDTIEFSRAVQIVLDATDPSETLVIVTADHGHVFTIAGYPTRGNDILGKVVGNDERGRPLERPATDAQGLPYTTLGYQNGPGYAVVSPLGPGGPDPQGGEPRPPVTAVTRPNLSDVDTADPSYRQEAAVPLGSESHSGEDVPVYATGPGSHRVRGVREQSFVYDVIVEALGWNDASRE
jgi:alkaline phosphatase